MDTSIFREMSLRQAEEEIVAACMDYEHVMETALSVLAVDDFRSEVADDLRLIFYVLAGMYARGAYDPATNRQTLLGLAESHEGHNRDLPAWEGYIDTLWCPWAASEEYVRELCMTVTRDKQLADEAMAAMQAWRDERVIDRPESPLPAAPQKEPRRKGGFIGGIQV